MAPDHLPEHGIVVLARHLPDLEAAVAGFIRRPIGEGRERPHGLPPLEGGDVQALQPGGKVRQFQAGLEVLKGGPGVRGSAAASEGVPGIVGGSREQPGPVASRGHQQGNLGPFFVGEQGLQEPTIRDLSRQQHLVGQRPPLGVVELEEGPQQIAAGRQFREKIFPPAGDQTGPHQKHRDQGLALVRRQAQDVLIAEIGPGHILALQGGGDGLDPVPEGGGPLKIQFVGGLGHLGLELFQEIAALASEKQDGFGHRLAVIGLAHQPGAGSQAVEQLVLQAGAGAGRQAPLLAGAHPEGLLHDFQGFPGHAAGGVGAEIEGPVRVKPPDEPEGREGFLQVQAEAEIIFVIPKHDVVTGPVLLDEVALQDEGFPAGGGEDHIHPGHFLEHQGGLGVVLLRGLEVGGQAVLEVHGLADVEHPAAGVLEQIDAAALGDAEQGRGQGRIRRRGLYIGGGHLILRITARRALSRRVSEWGGPPCPPKP